MVAVLLIARDDLCCPTSAGRAMIQLGIGVAISGGARSVIVERRLVKSHTKAITDIQTSRAAVGEHPLGVQHSLAM